ncbi:MAG: starch-binding protein, partial [Muribaculaceae bacterium]|nr:starch-binding protein [Muribaculaceae bacterium]
MKKFMTLLCLTALATLGFQANAELWLIGAISPDGWVTNKGVQFEQVDQNNYKLELDVTATGNQYYSLTTQLGNSWDAIKASRFGGSMEVALDTPTVLEAGTDQSPYTNFTAGTFVFEFNISTRTLTVSKKQDIVVPTFNGTVYITKTSIGNIWAWDGDGDYFDAWPGKAINTLETATVQGNEYYTFTYTHNSTNPGLIFNDGSAQTDNLVPEDGKLYDYTGGTTVSVSEPGAPDTTIVVEESLALRGSFNEWGETAMTKGENGLWTITQEMEAGAEFKFYDEQGNWIGGEADGNFVVTKEQVENGTALTLLVGAGNNFQIPVAGTWTLTVNKAENTLVVSGVWPSDTPDEAMYLIGSFNEWNTETQVAMTKGDDGKWTVKQAMEAGAEFKLRNELGTWIGAQSEGNFIVTKEQVANGDSLTIGEGDAFQNFEIPVAGEWTITVDREAMKLVIAGEWDEPVVEQAMYLIGSFNEWSDSTKVAMTKGENGLWTVAQEMAADAEFKFVDE